MSEFKLIYVTTRDLVEAQYLGREMVEQRLAACANVLPGMHSMYYWEGNLCEDDEVVLLLKTAANRVDDLVQAIKTAHSYDCPCVLVLPIEAGNPDYLAWLKKSLEGA